MEYGGKRSGPMFLHRACWVAKMMDLCGRVYIALQNARETGFK